MPFVGDEGDVHVHVHGAFHDGFHVHDSIHDTFHGQRDRKRSRSDTEHDAPHAHSDGSHEHEHEHEQGGHPRSQPEHAAQPVSKRSKADERSIVAVTLPADAPNITNITNINITDLGIQRFNFLISPCHVCSRRPNKKTLDCFATCGLCGQRACYVCRRTCGGPEDSKTAVHYSSEMQTDVRKMGMQTDTKMDMQADIKMEVEMDMEMDENYDYNSRQRLPLRRRRGAARRWPARSRPAREMPIALEHADVVCSRCCVEGDDGRITCLGCLPGNTIG